MVDLVKLVNEYYPAQRSIEDKKVRFTLNTKALPGFPSKGLIDSGELKIPMVETDDYYFFDIRPIYYSFTPWLSKINITNVIIGIFVLVIGVYILGGISFGIILHPDLFGIFMIVTFLGGAIVILNFNKTIANILVIKKAWVNNTKEENGSTTLTWSLPKDVSGFSFLHLLTIEQKNKLPFYLKLQMGGGSGGLRRLSPVSFDNIEVVITG